MTQTGEMDGILQIDMRGGTGNDVLTAAINLANDSEGQLFVQLLGQAGNDVATAVVQNANKLSLFTTNVQN